MVSISALAAATFASPTFPEDHWGHQRGENSDYRYDDEQLDQRKATP
jgi:hypothetical protein